MKFFNVLVLSFFYCCIPNFSQASSDAVASKYSKSEETFSCGCCLFRKATARCAKCNAAFYCSVECQKHHWKLHKLCCRPKPIKAEAEQLLALHKELEAASSDSFPRSTEVFYKAVLPFAKLTVDSFDKNPIISSYLDDALDKTLSRTLLSGAILYSNLKALNEDGLLTTTGTLVIAGCGVIGAHEIAAFLSPYSYWDKIIAFDRSTEDLKVSLTLWKSDSVDSTDERVNFYIADGGNIATWNTIKSTPTTDRITVVYQHPAVRVREEAHLEEVTSFLTGCKNLGPGVQVIVFNKSLEEADIVKGIYERNNFKVILPPKKLSNKLDAMGMYASRFAGHVISEEDLGAEYRYGTVAIFETPHPSK